MRFLTTVRHCFLYSPGRHGVGPSDRRIHRPDQGRTIQQHHLIDHGHHVFETRFVAGGRAAQIPVRPHAGADRAADQTGLVQSALNFAPGQYDREYSMGISTVSKPHFLNCGNSLVLWVVNGEVKRNVLMPSLIVPQTRHWRAGFKCEFPPPRFHLETRQAARRRERHRHAQIEAAVQRALRLAPASVSASAIAQSVRRLDAQAQFRQAWPIGPPPPRIRQLRRIRAPFPRPPSG